MEGSHQLGDVIHALFSIAQIWLEITGNYNNNNIRLICQDKPLDHNASYIYTSVSQDR